MTALGRIQITRGTPICQPGKCIVCGAVEGKFVDFGFEIDFYGVVYFCSHCVAEVSAAIGFLPVDRFSELEERLQEQINKSEELKSENSELRNALDSLNRVGFVFSDTSNDQLSLDEVKSESSKNSERATDAEPARETRPPQQNDEPGFTSLPNDESISSIFKL